MDKPKQADISYEIEVLSNRLLKTETPGQLYGIFASFPKDSVTSLKAMFIKCEIGSDDSKYNLAQNILTLLKNITKHKSELSTYLAGGVTSIGKFLQLIQEEVELKIALENQTQSSNNEIQSANKHSQEQHSEISEKIKLLNHFVKLSTSQNQHGLQNFFIKLSFMAKNKEGFDTTSEILQGFFLEGDEIAKESIRKWSAICLVSTLTSAASIIKRGTKNHNLYDLLNLVAKDEKLTKELGRISKRGMAGISIFKTLY